MDKIIISTGYMGSGSSAITDLIAEFSDCRNDFKTYEYVMMHCPNGLFDLEDRLLLGNNAIRSDEAIRTFYRCMNDLYQKKYWWVGNYQKVVGDDFMEVVKRFVDQITQFKFTGYWYMHEYTDWKMIVKLIMIKPFKILFHKFFYFKKITRYNENMMISYINDEDFYVAAKEFINNVITMMKKDSSAVILDQFLLPFNLYRMEHYFDDNAYAIVVQRDPRDVFIINKYTWVKNKIGLPIPTDVHMFCEYYKKMRMSEKATNNPQILRINFEDLIYNYDETVATIRQHVGYSKQDHQRPKSRFNPDLSIKNTQLFKADKYREEAAIMEKELSEYLYDFPYEVTNDINNTVEFS